MTLNFNYKSFIYVSLTVNIDLFLNLILYIMKVIMNKIFDYKNESDFVKENVQYNNCIIKGLNFNYDTLSKVWFDKCLLQNIEIHNALLDNVRFYNNCPVHSFDADNTIFDNCLFDETGILNWNIRNAQFLASAFIDVTLTAGSFSNAENSRFINNNGLNIPPILKSMWNITIT